MRLVKVSYPRPGQTILCSKCGHFHRADQMVADLDGEAYKAYYCDPGCRPDNFDKREDSTCSE